MKQDDQLSLPHIDLPKRKRGRPATGTKSAAKRQAESRARRKALTFESFKGQQVSWMLKPEAVQAIRILSHDCGMTQKEVVEYLLVSAYAIHLNNAE